MSKFIIVCPECNSQELEMIEREGYDEYLFECVGCEFEFEQSKGLFDEI